MAFLLAQRPLSAAVAGLARLSLRQVAVAAPAPAIRPALPSLAATSMLQLDGRRHASVKAQGAYRKKNKRGIPKKLGAKRIGDQYVLTGSIIFKQRGMHWWPGENCIVGRDHSIHAIKSGFVKYYRDPRRHPDRNFIGVVFDKADTLPYPANAERKRRLGKTVHRIRAEAPAPTVSPSGLPVEVRRVQEGQPDRLLRLRDDYSYREDNWAVGRLAPTTGLRTQRFRTRKQWFRNRRWKRERELEGHRKGAVRRAALGEGADAGAGGAGATKVVSKKAAKKAAKKKADKKAKR